MNPSLSEAVSFFFSQVDDPQALRFLESEKERLVRVYDESGIKNLRLLKQTIWDFERLFKFVPKRYSQHRNFSDFFSLFFALSIEYKSGSLRSKDISERTRARMKDIKASTRGQLGKGSEKVEFSPFKLLDDKYGSVDIYREWPTDSFMFDVIVNGRVLPNAVENEMSASPYFGVSDKTPNWKILWEFFDIPESVIQKALDELWEEIEKKQITNPLHFLQVWGILFFYSELKIVNFSRSDILKKGSCYINDLVRDDRFSILDPNDPWNSDITSFDGYGFHEIDSDEMVQLIKLVKRAQEEALKRKLPKLAEELCEQMQHDIDAFNAAISSPSAKNSLYSTPVFTSVPVDEFWDNLLNLEPAAHTKVFSGLKARYAGRRLLNELQVEAPWLKEFERRGKERIKNLSPILGAQLEKRLQLIGRLVVEFDEEK
ncbi:hypothetical protein C9993_08395 [Marinobacter sp. Z-F4-2]|nr:hypothetical protein C9993_08395 [Marinobacter sp. Z-F4-2]